MNWTEMQSDWKIHAPLVATWWPRLTTSDLVRIAGSRGRLAEALCERFGIGLDEAEAQICAFEKDVRRPGAVK